MSDHLTRKQQVVLDYLVQHTHRLPHPPTLDELCQALNLKSKGSLHKHIQALINAGFVQPMHGHRRGVRLTDLAQVPAEPTALTLPLQGKIAAGKPIAALPQPDFIEIPRYLCTGPDNYVLQVEGDSMIDDGILDQDWVVIAPCAQANNGDVVVALIDQMDVTLKRIEQKRDQTLLHPANRRLQTMVYQPNQVQIQGRLVGLIRQFS